MRIGFDVSQTGAEKAGCGFFADSLVRALAHADTRNEYVLYPTFGTRFWDARHLETTCHIDRPRFGRLLEGLSHGDCLELWDRSERLEDELGRPDLVHSNNYYFPRRVRTPRIVYTLYDLVAVEHVEFTTEETRLTCFEGLFEASLAADWLVAISRHTRDRFLHLFPHYPADRISVVHPASRFQGSPPSRPRAAEEADLVPDAFWLCVGTLEPRKNLRRVIEAYAARVRAGETRPLAIAGGAGWKEEGLAAFIAGLGLEGGVRLLGYVDDPTLQWLYAHCFAFVYPSLAEGFGLPVVEAMSMGAAVITSDESSLPETAGEGGLTVCPREVAAIAAAMRELDASAALRDTLRSRAKARAREFSWEGAAREVLAIYDAVVDREPLRRERERARARLDSSPRILER